MKVDDCINLDDLRKIAKKRVPKIIYDFIEGGSEDEAGLARNEDAFRNRAACAGRQRSRGGGSD